MHDIMPPENERIHALRAMKTIALADGELHDKEVRLIQIAASAMQVTAKVEELEPIQPEALADKFTDTEAREGLVRRLVMLTTLDGEVTDDEVELLESFATALGVEERSVHNLRQLRDGHLKRLMFDLVRRSFLPSKMKWVAAEGGLSTIWDIIRSRLGFTNAKLAARCEALGELPEGTLGRAFHDHHPPAPPPAPRPPGTDARSELLVAGFQAGYLDEDPLVMYLMISLLFQLGIEPVAELRGVDPRKHQLDLDAYQIAYERGRAMNQSLVNWDAWPHMERPLEAVRQELGIPPLVD